MRTFTAAIMVGISHMTKRSSSILTLKVDTVHQRPHNRDIMGMAKAVAIQHILHRRARLPAAVMHRIMGLSTIRASIRATSMFLSLQHKYVFGTIT